MNRFQWNEAYNMIYDRMIADQSSIEANLRPGDREAAQRDYNICWVIKMILEELK